MCVRSQSASGTVFARQKTIPKATRWKVRMAPSHPAQGFQEGFALKNAFLRLVVTASAETNTECANPNAKKLQAIPCQRATVIMFAQILNTSPIRVQLRVAIRSGVN